MAVKQTAVPAFPFAIYYNQTATRQTPAPGVYVNETVTAPSPPAPGSTLSMMGV